MRYSYLEWRAFISELSTLILLSIRDLMKKYIIIYVIFAVQNK